MRVQYLFVAISALALAGCETVGPGPQADDSIITGSTPTVQEPGDPKYYRSDEPLKAGIEQFNRGHYGLAERYFRDAVEKEPKDVTAWVGLAAAYDRIGRFDLADRAYASAIKLGGETIEILNNLGYSHMLRGNFKAARKNFMKAYARDPGNPKVANNLRLLDGSQRFVNRKDAQ